MSTESNTSNTSNTAHTIRMSEEDWNELLVTAVNAGYKSRTEYIRATLNRGHMGQSAPPPLEIAPDNPRLMTPKIETEIRAELAARSAKIQQLETKWQETVASLEVYTNDAAKFLSRAEAAEAEVAQLTAELQAAPKQSQLDAANTRIEQLNLLIQDAVNFPNQSNNLKNKLPLTATRPPFQTIVSSWNEKERKEWMENKWKGSVEHWCKRTLDTAYAIMDSA